MSGTPPVWDGSGVDPWLPARLAALAEVAGAERTIRGSLWAAFAEWIVAVRRGVLATVRPDPIAVYAHSPQWAALVDQVVSGPIRDTLGLAYRALLGSGYRYDQRPAVVEYLASSTNRLVRVPDEVHSVVATQIARGAAEGESIPTITLRVEEVLSDTDTPRWPNRATVIARTETLGSLNAGRADAFAAVAEDLGRPFEKLWISTLDSRVRDSHRKADGQRVAVGGVFTLGGDEGDEGAVTLRHPGDPLGPIEATAQCRCTTLLVEPGETIDLTHRQFRNY